MASKEFERPVPRSLERDTSTPIREEGMGRKGYALIAAILLIIVIVGYSFYGMKPPSEPNNAPANERQTVSPPATTPR